MLTLIATLAAVAGWYEARRWKRKFNHAANLNDARVRRLLG